MKVEGDEVTSSPGLNPPLVNSLAYTADGRFLAVGLGDTSIPIFTCSTRAEVAVLNYGHTSTVASVHFSCFQERLLLSCGNDRALCFWDTAPLDREPLQLYATRPVFKITDLAGKPNCLITSSAASAKSIFIADTTREISMFTLPE